MTTESTAGKRPSGATNDKTEKWRSAPMIDIDRILYSPELRRLEGVTQVQSSQDDYVYHDRLTHSMKVAQVAERLAQKLLYDFNEKNKDTSANQTIRLCPDVCYAAGLAHDLGHPPFGHAAENEFQKILDENGALEDSFEGNAQSFRIVAKTSFRKAEKGKVMDIKEEGGFSATDGLDLTWRTLAAISKYPWLKGDQPNFNNKILNSKLAKKWGFYESEKKYFEYMKTHGYFHQYGEEEGKESLLKQSLEAQIMDWADDITYAVHDLEDYFRGKAVPLERLRLDPIFDDEIHFENFNKYAGHLSVVEWRNLYFFIKESIQNNLFHSRTKKPFNIEDIDILREIIDVRFEFPNTPFDGSPQSHDQLRHFGSTMIKHMQNNVKLNTAPSIAKTSKVEYYLEIKKEAQLRAAILKSIFKYYVVITPHIKIMQTGQRTVIRELYEKLTDLCSAAARSANLYDDTFSGDISKQFQQLPARLREYLFDSLAVALNEGRADCFREEIAELEDEQLANERKKITSRPVIDFICTLTDKQATLLHKRLTGDDIGILSPYWLNV